MLQIWLRFDLKCPDFGTKSNKLCSIALDQASWADKQGFDAVQLPEHHGSPDGYNPSPFVLGAAIAARSTHIRINPAAVLLPLHDPIRVAEDAVVLDNISNGRLTLTIGLGYVPAEFAMFGVSLRNRKELVDKKLDALRRALAGDRFIYEGRKVHVTPRPVQQPTPPVYIGGGVEASARRAAAVGDGFSPSTPSRELDQVYIDACEKLGKTPGPIITTSGGPQFIFVTNDPEEAWAKIAPHALYETNAYANWAAKAGGVAMPFRTIDDVDSLSDSGLYKVVTPNECIELGKKLSDTNTVMVFNSLLAGLPEELSWSSLELFSSKVLPVLKNLAE